MKREELKYKMLDKGGYQGETKAYIKEEADAVMDAMAKRIAELDETKSKMYDANQLMNANIKELEARIKELENKLYGRSGQSTRLLNRINNFRSTDPKATDLIEDCYKCIHQQMETISKMETTTPKWVSVKDRLPKGNPMIPALDEDNQVVWWGNWHDDNLDIYGITHWLDNALPPPPTTEEK